MEDRVENTKVLIKKNFNARTGRKESRVKGLNREKEIKKKQQSKNSKVNREGRGLCKFLEEQ